MVAAAHPEKHGRSAGNSRLLSERGWIALRPPGAWGPGGTDKTGQRGDRVKHFVRKLRGAQSPEARVVIETAPGEEAQVDYGTGPMVRDDRSRGSAGDHHAPLRARQHTAHLQRPVEDWGKCWVLWRRLRPCWT